MLNWYYTYRDTNNDCQVVGAIVTPSIPKLNFRQVLDELIIPYLKSKGISYPHKLTYERKKHAPPQADIVQAINIREELNVRGIIYSLKDGQPLGLSKAKGVECAS